MSVLSAVELFLTRKSARSSRVRALACIAGVRWLKAFKWVALAAVAVKLPHMVLRAAAALRGWVLDINMLMSIAVAGANARSATSIT